VENTTKFLDRWKTVLAGHGKPGVHPEREKDRGISGRALVIDHCTPTPDQDAGSITAINLMRILQGLGFKVTFIPEDNFLCMNPYTKDLQRIGIECLYAPHVKSLEQHLAKHGEQYDVVVVFRLLAAERHLGAVRKYCPNAKLVFHTSDLHYLREMREAELVGSDTLHKKARKTQERELRIIRAVDATIVHSLAEKHMLDTILKSEDSGRSNVHLFGWAIEIPGTQVPFEQRNGMAFVGGFQHPPNIDAVLWFAKDIFPIIRQELPDALLYIVGSRATQEILRLEGDGIKVVGYMEDLRPLLDRCRMSVVPIRYGAGIKGKIGTSLSYGLPCVSTTIGAEGMGLKEGDGVLVADDPADFAATVIRLHNDQALWNSCSQGGLDFVRRNYSLEAGIKTIHDVLKGTGLPENKMSESSIPEFLGSMNHETTKYQADQIDDPLEVVRKIQTVIEYNDWSHSPEYKICREKERDIISKHAAENIYNLPGYCKICEREVDFLIDRQCGAVQTGTGWMPNWRERMVCPMCGLNNRQRMIAVAARDKAMRYRDRMPSIYLMEQVTNIYKWFKNRLPQAHCVGSEYLGEKYCSGQIIKGIRHEDVEHLSFEDSSFDLVVSNDVLEHVENYRQALNELCRVIRPRGELLMTVPFHLDRENNEKRAEIVHGRLNHILPPLYHGNPVSDKGSLVFTDFGWEFLQDIRNAGFKKTTLHFYWSEVYGHLGAGQHYICATKE